MSTIPKKRVIFGWIIEFVFVLLNLILLPFTFFIKKIRFEGKNNTEAMILCDAISSPLIYIRLALFLKKQGLSVTIFSSGTIFSRISDHAKRTGDYLVEKNLNSVILFGHGMGGLIALKLPDASRQRIAHLVPIGTPYNGTRLLMFFWWIPALDDMAVGSEYILFNRTNAMLYNEFTPFCAWQDETIIPFNLSLFGQGRDLILDQVGHYNLILNSENISTICEIVIDGEVVEPPKIEDKKQDPETLATIQVPISKNKKTSAKATSKTDNKVKTKTSTTAKKLQKPKTLPLKKSHKKSGKKSITKKTRLKSKKKAIKRTAKKSGR